MTGKAGRRGPAPRWWPALRAGVWAAWALAGVVTVAAGAFWGLGAWPQWRAATPALAQAAAAARRDPGGTQQTAAALQARVRQEQTQLAALASALPGPPTTLQAAAAVFAWAQASGAAVNSISFGTPATQGSVVTLPVTVTLTAPGPAALLGFLQAAQSGAVPAAPQVTSLNLAPGPQTVTWTVDLYGRS